MKKFICISLLLFGALLKAQEQTFIENTWYLQEMNIANISYYPPINNEIESVWFEVEEFDNTYFFHSEVCSYLGGMLNWITNSQFSFFDFVGGFACEEPSNQEFEYQYAYFYGYGGVDGIPLDYTIDSSSDNSLELIVTNRFGDYLVYNNINLSTKDNNSNELEIYPNPLGNNLYFKTNKNLIDYSFEFYNLNGNLIDVFKVKNDNQIDVSHLSSGVYFLRIYDNSKNLIQSKKILKR